MHVVKVFSSNNIIIHSSFMCIYDLKIYVKQIAGFDWSSFEDLIYKSESINFLREYLINLKMIVCFILNIFVICDVLCSIYLLCYEYIIMGMYLLWPCMYLFRPRMYPLDHSCNFCDQVYYFLFNIVYVFFSMCINSISILLLIIIFWGFDIQIGKFNFLWELLINLKMIYLICWIFLLLCCVLYFFQCIYYNICILY